jgi:glycerol-3-phosphate acyltransferase PlsY
MVWTTAFLTLGAYLLGAVPFGVLIGKARGVDIREHGSRNIGATNAGRVLGRRWGYVCLALDILKGLLPTLAAKFLIVHPPIHSGMLLAWIVVGVAAVLGHTFPIYLGFRGGKGVATTIGVAIGIFPYLTIPMAAALAAYALLRFGTGIVSAGSLALAIVLPAAFFAYLAFEPEMTLREFWPLAVLATGLGLLIIVRHRSNIARLIRGEELAVRGANPNPSGE